MRNTVYIYKNLRLLRNLQSEVFSIFTHIVKISDGLVLVRNANK